MNTMGTSLMDFNLMTLEKYCPFRTITNCVETVLEREHIVYFRIEPC